MGDASGDLDLASTLQYPSIQELPEGEREAMFIRKLSACCSRCDFSNPRAEFAQKEAKRRHLVDITEYAVSNKGVFTEAVYERFFTMVSVNIFRALPLGTPNDEYADPEDDEPFLEPAWPHLQLIYELFRKFISGETDQKLLRTFVTTRFVLSIVELFDSEDPREREYLKTILHRIYGKIMPLRPFIRKSIMNVFYSYVFETHRHSGIAELLEILGSIINGFAVPLKEEHKVFLRRFLMPLHMPKGLPSYHVQLSFCITQFVEKEPALASDVVSGLMKQWPVTHSRKEVMLLNELEELVELGRPGEFDPIVELLFQRISRCIESPHFQVAERALFFWNNEHVVNLILQFRERVIPIVYGALYRNAQSHWNSNVLSLSFNVQKLLSEMDSALYEETAALFVQKQLTRQRERESRDKLWKDLCRRADEVALSSTLRSASGNTESAGRRSNDRFNPELGFKTVETSGAEGAVRAVLASPEDGAPAMNVLEISGSAEGIQRNYAELGVNVTPMNTRILQTGQSGCSRETTSARPNVCGCSDTIPAPTVGPSLAEGGLSVARCGTDGISPNDSDGIGRETDGLKNKHGRPLSEKNGNVSLEIGAVRTSNELACSSGVMGAARATVHEAKTVSTPEVFEFRLIGGSSRMVVKGSACGDDAIASV